MNDRKFRGFLISVVFLAFCLSGVTIAQDDVIIIFRPVVTSVFPNRGPTAGGTWINVIGRNFVTGAQAKIGTRGATRTLVVNSNRIITRTPIGVGGIYNVTVINPDGWSGTLPEAFTYQAIHSSPPDVDAGRDIDVDEGEEVTVIAEFVDNSGDTHIAVIDWGDGTISEGDIEYGGIISETKQREATVTASRVFEDDGDHDVTVTVVDNWGASGSDELEIDVDNEPPDMSVLQHRTITEGNPTVNMDIEFSDQGIHDTHTLSIQWGDGQTTNISRAVSPVAVEHTYPSDNSAYTITATVEDNDGGRDRKYPRITILNENPVIQPIEDIVLTESDPTADLSFTFTDPGALDTHTAFITWGDGASDRVDNATSPVTISHTYPIRSESYSLGITIQDDDGAIHSIDANVTVTNTAPVMDPISDQSATECEPTIEFVTNFTDSGTQDTHTALVNWGDGTVTDGVITEPTPTGDTPGTVGGHHTYAGEAGTYTVTVTLSDNDGASHTRTFVATIESSAPTFEGQLDTQRLDECNPLLSLQIPFDDCGISDRYAAQIDWGDGTSGEGQVSISDANSIPASGVVSGSHTYIRDDGTYTVTVALQDSEGGSDSMSFRVVVENEIPSFADELQDQVISECDPIASFQADITDCNSLDTHTVTVNWGDGIREILTPDRVGTVTGNHLYARDDGFYTVSLTVEDDDGGNQSTSFGVTVENENPVIASELADLTVSECGPSANFRANITDCDSLDTHTATITWGDGAETAGNIDQGVVSGSHTYVGDDGVYTVTLTVRDDDGGSQSESFNITVENENPVITSKLANQTVSECDPAISFQANFTDCDSLDTHIATVNWGDRTVEELTIIQDTIFGSHTYARDDAVYHITVAVEDDDGGIDYETFNIAVENESPVITSELSDIRVSECDSTVSFQADFADCDSLDTHLATVNWGNGTIGELTIIQDKIFGSYTYPGDDAVYRVTVEIEDDDGGSSFGFFTVTIENENPVITSELADQNVSECDPAVSFEANFLDCDSLDTHTATVNWGDGTEAELSADQGVVSGSHTYASNDAVYTVIVTVTDDDGGSQSESFAVTVENAAPVITSELADRVVDEGGTAIDLVASFIDCDSSDTHTADVNWGNGTETAALVNEAEGTFSGSHTYAGDDGMYAAMVTIQDDDGGSQSESFDVMINNQAPVIDAIDTQSILAGNPTLNLKAGFTDPGALDTHTAVINWGDGAVDNVDPATSPISVSHRYAGDQEQYKASITIRDDDGGSDSETFSVVVTNQKPVIEAISDQSVSESSPKISLRAVYTDPGANSHRAVIDWGDGEKEVIDPAISPIISSHTYLGDDGRYAASVKVEDDSDGSDSQSFIVTVVNETPAIAGPSDQSVNEGNPVIALNANFADSGSLDTHTATIDWGDGNSDSITSAVSPINISHTYPQDDGQYTVVLTIADDDGGSDKSSFSVIVSNEDPVIALLADWSIPADAPDVSLDADFTDSGALDTHIAEIKWGDGDIETADPAVSPVVIAHSYPENAAQYEVSVTVRDDNGGSDTQTFSVSVINEGISINPIADQFIDEADPTVFLNAEFSDLGAANTHTATIDWGDGDTETIDPATSPIVVSHTYPGDDGSYQGTVTIIDNDGRENSRGLVVNVENIAPVVNAGSDQTVDEGDEVVIHTSFTDAGLLDTHTVEIDWGDSTDTGNAYAILDGMTTYFSAGDVLDGGTNDICISAWIKKDEIPSSNAVIVEKYRSGIGYDLYIDTNGRLRGWFQDAGGYASGGGGANICDNKWHHIAIVFDRSGNMAIYVDGIPYGTVSDISSRNLSVDNAGDFTVGANSGGTQKFDGSIRNVRIWIGGVWSEPEILAQVSNPYDILAGGVNTSSWSFGDSATATSIMDNTGINDLALYGGSTTNYAAHSRTTMGSIDSVTDDGVGTLTASHIYTVRGIYTVTVIVIDDDGGVGMDSLDVAVNSLLLGVTSISPKSGNVGGGTRVTIRGQNFKDGVSVRFGGVSATNISLQSPTSITATAPPGPIGSVDVVVTNPDGQRGTLTDGFTYIGEIAFISIFPKNAEVEVGQTQRFTVSGRDALGNQYSVSNADVNWRVTDTEVGTINSSGTFTAAGIGTTTVVAALKSDTSISAEVEVEVPDTEPPTILSEQIFPDFDDADVPVTTSIPIIFSESIDMQSVRNGGINVEGNNGRDIEGDFSFDPETGILTFTPDELLKDEEMVTIIISTAIEDVVGNNLRSELRMSFSTGLSVWPGDSNNDGQVNVLDIIPLGQYWESDGQERDNANSNWELQTVAAWTPEKGATYADTNGDGEVNEEDILPIADNYKLLHDLNQLAPSKTLEEINIPNNPRLPGIYEAMYEVLDSVSIETEGVRALKDTLWKLLADIERQEIPQETKLRQNFPNPFNPETWIPYQLAEDASIRIRIYNMSGLLVRILDIGQQPAGYYVSKENAAYWDGRNQFGEQVTSGLYFCHLKAGKFEDIRKLIVVR